MKEPLVSIVTAVYNGAAYLSQCIDSVLSQSYENWEYIVADNCSTDSTLDVAHSYAKKDERIKVYSFEQFVDVMESHNRALRLISSGSKYCKVVCADDWIRADCIRKMIDLAEKYPAIGMVTAYAINKDGISYVGLPHERSVFQGEEICRFHLLGGPLVMGAPSASLYRSDIVRARERFYEGDALSADISTAYEILRGHDFGFLHEVLIVERIHDQQLSCQQDKLKAFYLDRIKFFVTFSRFFLSKEEAKRREEELLDYYYCRILVAAIWGRYPRQFWVHHKNELQKIGLELDRGRLVRAVTWKLVDSLCNPKRTIESLLQWKSVFDLPSGGVTVSFDTVKARGRLDGR